MITLPKSPEKPRTDPAKPRETPRTPSRGRIETAARIQYVSDGVFDDLNQKAFLYEAHDLRELRKLDIFDKVKKKGAQAGRPLPNRTVSSNLAPSSRATREGAVRRGTLRCFNCNEADHVMSSCPKPRRERGSCYACGSADHQKRFCPRLKIARPPPPSATVEDRTTRLIEMSHSVIFSYVVQANLQ